jgi:hypothetical protein
MGRQITGHSGQRRAVESNVNLKEIRTAAMRQLSLMGLSADILK